MTYIRRQNAECFQSYKTDPLPVELSVLWVKNAFFSYTVLALAKSKRPPDSNMSRRVLLSLLFLFQFPVLLLPLLLCLALIVHT